MIRYIGKGAYIQGVPARDLTEDEWAKVPAALKKDLMRLGLFEIEPAKAARKPKAIKIEVEEDLENDND